jgi:hypothetical protein
MKILVVQACADGILAKTRRNAKSAKTAITRGYYILLLTLALFAFLRVFARI